MANDKQFRLNTVFVGTRGVQEYRASIPVWVRAGDVVLEIGCEWGTTTALLAPHCCEVIGTDVSAGRGRSPSAGASPRSTSTCRGYRVIARFWM